MTVRAPAELVAYQPEASARQSCFRSSLTPWVCVDDEQCELNAFGHLDSGMQRLRLPNLCLPRVTRPKSRCFRV